MGWKLWRLWRKTLKKNAFRKSGGLNPTKLLVEPLFRKVSLVEVSLLLEIVSLIPSGQKCTHTENFWLWYTKKSLLRMHFSIKKFKEIHRSPQRGETCEFPNREEDARRHFTAWNSHLTNRKLHNDNAIDTGSIDTNSIMIAIQSIHDPHKNDKNGLRGPWVGKRMTQLDEKNYEVSYEANY